MDSFNFPSEKEQFTKTLADHVSVSIDDLSKIELELIDKAYSIFKDNQAEIKAQSDEVKRLSLELANLRAMTDTKQEKDFYCHDEAVANAMEDYDFEKCSKQCPRCRKEIEYEK